MRVCMHYMYEAKIYYTISKGQSTTAGIYVCIYIYVRVCTICMKLKLLHQFKRSKFNCRCIFVHMC